MPIDKLSANAFATGAIANSLGYTPANKAGDTFSGVTTFSANVALGATTITANGSVGTAGQVLTSGASGNAYWSTVATTLDAVLGIGNTTTKSLTTGPLTVNGVSTFTGNTLPSADATYDLGSITFRWNNIYTADAHFSNEGTDGNSIDGTTGSWTLQEGEDNIYMLNNKTGKRYKIKMEEV